MTEPNRPVLGHGYTLLAHPTVNMLAMLQRAFPCGHQLIGPRVPTHGTLNLAIVMRQYTCYFKDGWNMVLQMYVMLKLVVLC